MAELSSGQPVSWKELRSDNAATFEKIQELLKSKDDTSKFVGLALLKSVLDNGQLSQDQELLRTLWESISPKFIDRLLHSRPSDKVTKAEAQNMVDLAVAVLHTFAVLLPQDCQKDARLVGRTSPLVKALVESSQETTKLILQTLMTIVSQPEGSLELLRVEDLSPLTEIAPQHSSVLDILSFTWTNASAIGNDVKGVQQSIDKHMPKLLVTFKGTDAVTLISFFGNLIPKLTPEALPQSPKWLATLTTFLRKLISSRPTSVGRAAYTQLAASLLQAYPERAPHLLFSDHPEKGHQEPAESKPFSYLFINLLLIDLRSSFPSLLSKLNSVEYPEISERLSAAFDIISSFIGFLVRKLDEDYETSSSDFKMPPDLLLKLRKDLSETMSLTMEYLRDRWDSSIAGASGLHPDARTGTAATSEGTRLTLSWESMKDSVTEDPLILAGIRAIAIWIREDENENLRTECAGLMDMFINLYKSSNSGALDFRYPILLALEGILDTEDGAEGFLGQGGWEVLFADLDAILSTASKDSVPGISTSSTAARGLEVVRVLLAVVDHSSTTYPREDWMSVVTTTAALKAPPASSPPIVVELHIAMLQLSTALLSKAAAGAQKRYLTANHALSGLRNQLQTVVEEMDDKEEAAEFISLLDDVQLELVNLRLVS